jgi:ABC-type branched-subunit amino acid transport system ATPase component
MTTEDHDPVENILRTHGMNKYFGGLHAVDSVSLSVREGEILSIIGPNGAGKTTLFNLITGVFQPSGGSTELFVPGRGWAELTGRATHEIAELGLVRTFQNARPFHGLTVRENILAGMGLERYRSLEMFGRYDTQEDIARANTILADVGLAEHADTQGSNLPLALQRRLEIGRALALEPRILLLDEPAAGLNDEENRSLVSLLQTIRNRDTTIVLIEHTMEVVMSVSDRIVVLDQGAVIAEGNPGTIRTNPRVKEAYLGEEDIDQIDITGDQNA